MNPLVLFLIQQFTPYIWIHSQEKYYPYDIQSYIDHSELWCNGTLITNTSNITYGKSTTECALKPQEIVMDGFKDNLTQAPVYVHYRDFKDYFEIKYLFFYGYNGAYNILHFFNYLDVNYGEHYGDLEHITLQFTNTTDTNDKYKRNVVKLKKIYLAAHTSMEGEWLEPDQIKWKGKRPVIYSALNGHGSYPSVGSYYRIYGFANDYCNQGTLWDPKEILLLNNNRDEWHRYQGDYNFRGELDNNVKNLFSMTTGNPLPETNTSTNPVNRFFYFYPELLGLTS